MNNKRRTASVAACAMFIASICPAATFHHQGVVAVQGERFSGQGAFRTSDAGHARHRSG